MFKRSISLLIVLVLVFSLLVGCNNEAVNEDLGDEEYIEIKDMAGRIVLVPAKAEKVFATIPTGTILLYSLNPEKMIGWNYDLREGEKRFIDEEYHDLPNLGGAGKNAINIEEMLKMDPAFLIIMEELDEDTISKAEELEEQTGKPVILLDSDLHKLDEAYKILGKALREEERAEKLGNYCKETMEDIENNISRINKEEKVRVYYAEGPNGLETEPSDSWHAEIIDMVGGENVAEVELKGDKGKSEVSIEQLLIWNPDLIISWDDERGGYYSGIFEDSAWQSIKAVENGEIYEIPNKPFNWFDRPPSVNRILGVKWLGNLLYPDIFDYNMEEEVKEFYNLFYHYQLTEGEIEELLRNSTRY
ncbi:ABC transporter substrate-binding protein [Schnuerera ultunensis]|uniref:ABC-type transporter, periplasmic subunit n=1 Tax=[Clostridium] ultunense Esp TaxID=1288971 RepID=A0A1M4PLP8_9FIRM|nr:ABC transporter substrate-binding protein [Schnuerera ultunensis]SHD76387.1 ABC-type transporter, periplasmic subunit [[Clostridium] ultunense Esp]